MGLTVTLGVHASTAELKPATVAAFERYVRATEARIAGEVADERRFLYVDTLGETTRARLAELAAGRLVIERLRTLEKGEPIEAPDGLIHHWLGVVFVPGGTAAAAVDLLRDYDRHAAIYRPAIERSRVLEQSGDTYQVFLRFFMKKVIAVTVNSEHTARFTSNRFAPHVQPGCQHACAGSRAPRDAVRARAAGRKRQRLPLANQQLLAIPRARWRRLPPM